MDVKDIRGTGCPRALEVAAFLGKTMQQVTSFFIDSQSPNSLLAAIYKVKKEHLLTEIVLTEACALAVS